MISIQLKAEFTVYFQYGHLNHWFSMSVFWMETFKSFQDTVAVFLHSAIRTFFSQSGALSVVPEGSLPSGRRNERAECKACDPQRKHWKLPEGWRAEVYRGERCATSSQRLRGNQMVYHLCNIFHTLGVTRRETISYYRTPKTPIVYDDTETSLFHLNPLAEHFKNISLNPGSMLSKPHETYLCRIIYV